MRQIYQHANLTLVAASAESVSAGFLSNNHKLDYKIEPFEIGLDDRNETTESVAVGYLSGYMRDRDSVNSRAWIFQEQLLSPHIMMFSYNGIHLICSKGHAGNNHRHGLMKQLLPDINLEIPLFADAFQEPHMARIETLTTTRQLWLLIRTEYTRRHLSYGKDKLNAIAAVAEAVSGAPELGPVYFAGLWQKSLVEDLHWMRMYPLNARLHIRPKDYRAPSWSWASIDGHVIHEDRDETARETFHFKIVRCAVDLDSPNFPFGAVTGGLLVVEGRMRTFFWNFAKDAKTADADGFLYEIADGSRKSIVGEVNLDAIEPQLRSDIAVNCIAMSLLRYRQRQIAGLLLLPANSGCYRRVGFFRVWNPTTFENAVNSVVSVI
jgi:hypothetical protein